MSPRMTGDCRLSTADCSGSSQRRVVHLPVYKDNAYQPMLMEAQRKLGWEVIDGGGGGNFLKTALRQWTPDILHLHWLHPYLLRDGAMASWMRGLRFLAEIVLIRRAGAKIVWTLHNFVNHDQRHAAIELALTRRFVRHCDLILVHGSYAEKFGRGQLAIPASTPVITVRHPNYCSAKQQGATSLVKEKESNDGMLVGFLGRIEPYKQVVELVQAFRSIASESDQLRICGRAGEAYAGEVNLAIAGDQRILFRDQYVLQNDIEEWMSGVDIVACPSRGILTSGSVILAMSFGRPVLAPSDGCIPEEVGDTGFLYDNSEPDGLRRGLKQAFDQRSRLLALGERALARAREASPELVARQIVSAYESILK